MKRLISVTLLFMGLMMLTTGCTQDDSSNAGPASLTLQQRELSVPAEGGSFSIKYNLENPVPGAELKVSSEHGWAKNFDTTTPGEIRFEVNPSYEEKERSCRVEVIYPGLYPNPTFTIKQAVGMEHAFELNVKKVMANTIYMDVVPKDKTQPYIFLLGKKGYMVEEGLLDDDAAQIASDMEVIASFGEAFGAGLKEVIGAFMYVGDQIDYTWNGVSVGTEYVAYAYGFDVDTMKPTTEVCRVEITTPQVQYYKVNFELEIETDGPNVSFDITPQGYDGYYFFGIFDAASCPPDTSEELLMSYCEASWEEYKGVYSPFFETPEQGLHFIFNELAYSGKTHFETELTADTEYVLWAVGMNDEALLNTTPVVEYFTTGGAIRSDNQFTITITDIKAREATVTVETTNDDPYAAIIAPVTRFEGMTDDEIMDDVCRNWNYGISNGGFTTKAADLKPETEYEILAFGVNGGRPSTQLTRQRFTTAAPVVSSAAFSLEFGNYYDIAEVATLAPEWSDYMDTDLIIPVTAVVDDMARNVYFSVMDRENFDFYTRDSNEMIVEALRQEGAAEELSTHFLLNYDMEFVFFGFVEDNDGNYTDLWVSDPVVFTKDGASPAQEFVDSLPEVEESARPTERLRSFTRSGAVQPDGCRSLVAE